MEPPDFNHGEGVRVDNDYVKTAYNNPKEYRCIDYSKVKK